MRSLAADYFKDNNEKKERYDIVNSDYSNYIEIHDLNELCAHHKLWFYQNPDSDVNELHRTSREYVTNIYTYVLCKHVNGNHFNLMIRDVKEEHRVYFEKYKDSYSRNWSDSKYQQDYEAYKENNSISDTPRTTTTALTETEYYPGEEINVHNDGLKENLEQHFASEDLSEVPVISQEEASEVPFISQKEALENKKELDETIELFGVDYLISVSFIFAVS